MLNKLVVFFLIFTSFYCIAVEQITTSEGLQEQNRIEIIRSAVKTYSDLTRREKKEYLLDLGVTEKEFDNVIAISELNWKTEGTHQLPQSHSKITLPPGYAIVLGNEAITLRKLSGDSDTENIEAEVYVTRNSDDAIIFQSFKIGYVSVDDWGELDPKKLLNEIIENTNEENKQRRKNGITELNVIGWIQEPTLDRQNNTVYWALDAMSGKESIVNSVAFRLGREGYEKITWITTRSEYTASGGHLGVMLRAHSYDSGYQYSDYKIGDKLADVGIAALVGATVGAKLLKMGGLFAIFKKLIYFIIAGIGGLLYKFKNLFKKKKEESVMET